MEEESFRIEEDSMGEMRVPKGAYYGPQTARAVENFPISGRRLPRQFLRALGMLKREAARVNGELGLLEPERSKAIVDAAQEVADGRWDEHFVVDVFQTGSGTSTNMNANEVIARRSSELLGSSGAVHPNDHVNRCQSSNDVVPSVIHVSALEAIRRDLIPGLARLEESLKAKSLEFSNVLKLGRTHLQDATPMWLGQAFGGYAEQIRKGIERVRRSSEGLEELALGGTAVGTGLNAHPEFAGKVVEGLDLQLRLNLREAGNHFEAQASKDACVEVSGSLKTVATSLLKVANDVRFLGSGPRGGLGELKLEATQPGSSIMPGKVNPVMCEMLMQVSTQVVGNDTTITLGGGFGNFELNVMMPMIALNLLESIEILANGSRVFSDRCIQGLNADEERCASLANQSLMLCTALAPKIGYDEAAKLAKKAYQSNRTIMETALEETDLDEETLKELLDPRKQIP